MSPKHKETQAMSIYLGIHRIALFWIWTVSEDIFGWTYLYLYLYLNRCICICICIWINVEQNICICIWKIQIFVFVFVFDKTNLTPALPDIYRYYRYKQFDNRYGFSISIGNTKRKHQSSMSLAFVRGIHLCQVNSPHKGPVTRKMFLFDDVIMEWKVWSAKGDKAP